MCARRFLPQATAVIRTGTFSSLSSILSNMMHGFVRGQEGLGTTRQGRIPYARTGRRANRADVPLVNGDSLVTGSRPTVAAVPSAHSLPINAMTSAFRLTTLGSARSTKRARRLCRRHCPRLPFDAGVGIRPRFGNSDEGFERHGPLTNRRAGCLAVYNAVGDISCIPPVPARSYADGLPFHERLRNFRRPTRRVYPRAVHAPRTNTADAKPPSRNPTEKPSRSPGIAMINPESRGISTAPSQGNDLALAPSANPSAATAIATDHRNTVTLNGTGPGASSATTASEKYARAQTTQTVAAAFTRTILIGKYSR